MKIIRQGDVLLKKMPALPEHAARQEGPCILAYGEVTGHAHQVKAHGEIWVDPNETGRRYLKVLADTSLDHEEHSRAALTQGDVYEIVIQREYHPDATRSVVD